jgi:hypothetical protein
MRVSRTPRRGLGRRRSSAQKVRSTRDLPAFVALAAAALLAATPAAAAPTDPAGVGGRVLGTASPLPSAIVYAYQLADRSHRRVLTDGEGGFLFDGLPAGLYKIVAHKPGFVPMVLPLTRATADAYQYLELQLAAAEETEARGGRDFWSVQAEIPPDVLRDMTIAELEAATRTGWTAAPRAAFQTALQVEQGVDDIAARGTDARVSIGRVDIGADLGQVRLGLTGDYLQLAPARTDDARGGADALDGQRSALSLEMANGEQTRVNLSSQSNHMSGTAGAGGSFDFEQHRLSLSHALGVHSRSQLVAQYTSESNYHRLGWIEPAAIPEASQSWRVEGSYQHDLSHRSSLETGFRYRQLEIGSADGGVLPELAQERVDLYARSGLRVQPALVVEYGLYTTLYDGTMSLIPQTGLVLQLAPTWQMSVLASHRFDDEPERPNGFLPVYFAETGDCDQNEAQCYQLVFTHEKDEEQTLSFGATHREFGEVERVYFDEGFFNRFESLYLVPGDRVPELQFTASRRLTPTIVTRLESSFGAGGGGIFRAADHSRYENQVGYLVTSLDTRFQATSTGLYVAFHRLHQELDALDRGATPVSEVEVERLQVRVTQDLGFLRELAADWALKLDMELSRGASPYDLDSPDDEIRRRLLGGIAVSF